MEIGYTPEQEAMRSELRAYYDKLLDPATVAELTAAHGTGESPRRIWKQMCTDGWAGIGWPKEYGGQGRSAIEQFIFFDESMRAGAPVPMLTINSVAPTIMRYGSEEQKQFYVPKILKGEIHFAIGYTESDAGTDLASLKTRAVRDGDEYVIEGHKIWTSYSDVADWCILLARTDPSVPKHKGISAFAVPMHQAGIEQRPLKMINGITSEFGQVLFDGARVPAANMIGEPGEGWALAMTVVSHEREPTELGYVARYSKLVKELESRVRADPERFRPDQVATLGRAYVESEMLRLHVRRRLSERLDGLTHGPEGSIDKLLMTGVEQAVGHAALAVGEPSPVLDADDTWLKVYLYSRAQSVMGGTAQIQKNIIATRILGLPTS
jgi:alkylation response protein AidB-like acyl-CoA dehydrogenase